MNLDEIIWSGAVSVVDGGEQVQSVPKVNAGAVGGVRKRVRVLVFRLFGMSSWASIAAQISDSGKFHKNKVGSKCIIRKIINLYHQKYANM